MAQGEYRPIEMGLKIGLGDVQAGNAEADNYDKAGNYKSEPIHQGYFKAPGARVPVENYYSKQEQCN